jgi:hypothetical protein
LRIGYATACHWLPSAFALNRRGYSSPQPLAVKNRGRLVSFDQRIPMSAVRDAHAEHLVWL